MTPTRSATLTPREVQGLVDGYNPEGDPMSDAALKLAQAYNPRTTTLAPTFPATDRERWLAVARAVTTMPDDREAAAAHLHAVYVRDIPVQREHGWPPRSDSERDRWLAVADAARDPDPEPSP